ncbi:hypothetical protein SUGI_0853240 [Cryptomeria japonica]|nr:hypothetical protein SUGI_0853240 [Cryptomeria japonica]
MEKYTWVVLVMSWSTAIVYCNCNSIQCLPEERLILLRFNTGIGGLSVPWKGLNCCEWDGVECSNRTSHVTHLRLSKLVVQNSSGTHILTPLFQLKQLEYLDLSSNGFTGVIPAGISELPELRHLDLSDNDFEGEVPLQLGNLSNLNYLSIAMAEKAVFKCWSNLQWVRNLRRLQYLSVRHVEVRSSNKELGEFISPLDNLQILDMSDCNMSGPIPKALLNLTSLTDLDLHVNTFSSPIPPWLGNMTGLVSLSFHNCNISGPFPLSLSTLPQLKNLRLSDNEFLSGDISEILGSGWPHLALFTLSGSNIRGSIPAFIGNLSSLTIFKVVETMINGPIPASLGSLPLLEELILRNNFLTGRIPPRISQLSKLKILDLSFNQLSGNIPSHLHGFSSLRKLYLQSNKLNGTIPTSIGDLPHVQQIDLSFNRLQGSFSLDVFENTPRLIRLYLSHNQLTVHLSSGWEPPIYFQVLRLASCNIRGPIPTFLSKQKRLLGLDISNNSFTGAIPTWFWDLNITSNLNLSYNNLEGPLPPNLDIGLYMTLDLQHNKLSGSLPSPSKASQALQTLNLSYNNFTGTIPIQIGILLPKIQVLGLSNNKLSGKIPSSITTCTLLRRLNLAKNGLEGDIPSTMGYIPPELAYLSNLHVLDLSENNLNGSIPPELEKLATGMVQSKSSKEQPMEEKPSYYREEILVTNKENDLVYVDSILLLVTCIDLSGNQLSGNIPSEIGALSGLRILNISRNNLSGEIPHTLGMLELIESLDLSYNNLQGKIPIEMQGLHYLAVFSVSNNKLCGKIPTEGQFSTFKVAYFYGNPCLCGFLLDIRCPESPATGDNEEEGEENETGDPWYWYVGCLVCFAVGFWGVFALLRIKTWRTRYNNIMDDAAASFCDSLTVQWKSFLVNNFTRQ